MGFKLSSRSVLACFAQGLSESEFEGIRRSLGRGPEGLLDDVEVALEAVQSLWERPPPGAQDLLHDVAQFGLRPVEEGVEVLHVLLSICVGLSDFLEHFGHLVQLFDALFLMSGNELPLFGAECAGPVHGGRQVRD